jgi:glutamate racemase
MIPSLSTKSTPRRSDPIGVFDSGIGGLSVLRELQRLMPHERFVFYADQKHVPYGAKSAAQLKRYTTNITRFLLAKRCKIIVVACNTGTVYAIDHLRRTFSVPFVGTVPAIKPAARMSRSGVVGILSTQATAVSPALRALVREHANDTRVLRIGCPGLEDLVEAGEVRGPIVTEALRGHLRPLVAAHADVIVLGCTHYPFLSPIIRRMTGAVITDSGRAIARRTHTLLADANLLRMAGRGTAVFFTNGSPQSFSRVASLLLRRRIRGRIAPR